jgi:hypothetical protein
MSRVRRARIGPKYVIRKSGLAEDLYLSPSGQWVEYGKGARCASQNAADTLAAGHGLDLSDYGLFPTKQRKRFTVKK